MCQLAIEMPDQNLIQQLESEESLPSIGGLQFQNEIEKSDAEVTDWRPVDSRKSFCLRLLMARRV